MTSDQKITIARGVKRGRIKRVWTGIWKFTWQFIGVALLCFIVVGGLAYLIVRDNTVHLPQQEVYYDANARAVPHE